MQYLILLSNVTKLLFIYLFLYWSYASYGKFHGIFKATKLMRLFLSLLTLSKITFTETIENNLIKLTFLRINHSFRDFLVMEKLVIEKL